MVTTDISQLAAECNTWRQLLRSYRDELTQLKNQLRQIALHVSKKDQLQDVEHYENQFHIQLINIHDLKHSIKAHDQKASLERLSNNCQVSDITWAMHERLHEQYERLDHMLNELKGAFKEFLAKLN